MIKICTICLTAILTVSAQGHPCDSVLNNPGIVRFCHSSDFFQQIDRYLKTNNVAPIWHRKYEFLPRHPLYSIIIKYLVEELGGLPIHGEVGTTTLLRKDAAKVINDLKAFLSDEQENPQRLSAGIAGWFEAFKNEIYPEHGISGIGYNLDLISTFDHGRHIVAGFILERYRITHAPFSVFDDVAFEFNIFSRRLTLELFGNPTVNVHLGH